MSNTAQGHCQAEKAVLRSEMLALRKTVKANNPDAPALLQAQVSANVKDLSSAVVAGYVAIGDEIDPVHTLKFLQDNGANICLPVAGQASEVLTFKKWGVGEPLDQGRHKTYQPGERSDTVIPNIILVPLVAFDVNGYRLGFGGGYYDRTLTYLRQGRSIAAYGMAFDEQQVDAIPIEEFDARLDGIFTPTRFVQPKLVGRSAL